MNDLHAYITTLSVRRRELLSIWLNEMLASAPETRQAPGDPQLTAYIVCRSGHLVTEKELCEFLKEKLPDYMVPEAFVLVKDLPLMPNGKVDRRALLCIDGTDLHDLDIDYAAPGTPTEEMLKGLWQEILQQQTVSIHDNFFRLGGHSLLAMQLSSRVRDIFSIELSVRRLFELPTLAKLAEHIEAIRRQDRKPIAPISVISREVPLSLSFAQKRLWFLSQLEGSSATYNMAAEVDLIGQLDVDALEQSLTEIVQRHEALRTTFALEDGAPVQMIAPPKAVILQAIDLQALTNEEADTEARRLADVAIRDPFDLSRGPLIRFQLLRLGHQKHRLLLSMHHIVSDGWSINVFFRELAAIYAASSQGFASPLPDLFIQYGDFSYWQNQYLTPEVQQTHLDYWQQHLAGAPPLLELPTSRPRPPVQTFQGGTVVFEIDKNLKQRLESLGQEVGATLFMTLLAAFKILLARYSGQTDIVVGTPIANRQRSELEPLIGFFANTLVLRTQLQANQNFLDVLSQVRKIALDAYAHQDMPFEHLVEALNPERHLSHAPLFQIMFVLQNQPLRTLESGRVLMSSRDLFNATAKFDIVLSMEETAQGLIGQLEYNSDLFERETIIRMIGHYQTVLQAITLNPEEQIQSLPLLTYEEYQLLKSFNQTQADLLHSIDCMHHLFETQAEQFPDQLAVIGPEIDQALTYRDLNARANHLAHHLQLLGVRPEVLVGICLERSLAMVIAVLAVWKAGGAYVPLDPSYPQERLHFMLEDSQAAVLLKQEDIILDTPATTKIVRLDDFPLTEESHDNIRSTVTPDNLVYITYTSGSTGKPKGIAMTHRAVANLISWHVATSTLSQGSRTLQFAPLSFDVSFQEMLATWCAGGTLVLLSEQERRDPLIMLELLKTRAIERLFLPTAALQHLAIAGMQAQALPTGLREVWVGGEQLRITREIRSLFSRLEHCTLYNYYGPSECHAVTVAPLDQDVTKWAKLPSIGRAIPNTMIYILDEQQQPVPVGVPGEIYIGGNCVARGYLNRPELTQNKFIPDRFAGHLGSRLYCTGDLARYLPDGNIEFLGRNDSQVKIRGVRIEITEIESVIEQHEDVHTAVVIVRSGNIKSLVAYVKPTEGRSLQVSDLRYYLRKRLPAYMVPSAFEVVEMIPLTPNGKVDRRALPEPRASNLRVEDQFVAPRNRLELQLAQIWSDVLEVHPVGIQQNFFELGGHSLAAVSLMSKLHQQLGISLPLATLFQGPTIEELASIVCNHASLSSWSPLVPIRTSGDQTPFFCIHPVGGNVLCYAALAYHLGPEQAFYGLQAFGLQDDQSPLRSIEEMATSYIEALQRVQPEGPYQLGGWSLGGVIAFEMAQQLLQGGHKVALLALIDSTAPRPGDRSVDADAQVTKDESTKWVSAFIRDLSGFVGEELSNGFNEHEELTIEERDLKLLKRAGEMHFIAPDDRVGRLDKLVSVFRTNLQAMYRYVPHRYDGCITVFRASEQDEQGIEDTTLGWQQYAIGGVESYTIPGNHYEIVTNPQVATLAAELSRCLLTA